MAKSKIAPFLKWVGGKRQLIAAITELLPDNIGTYYEPFIGGGALLFHLKPQKAVINDFNEELINVYKVIKEEVDNLIVDLQTHKNESDYFYDLRIQDRQEGFEKWSPLKKASRVIYLNKTCFNGLYRVNRSGEFNAPFGRYKNPNIVNEKTLRAVSQYLNENDIQIYNKDFEMVLKKAKKEAFVYFDPPYDPVSKSANFTGYVQGGFGEADQIRLRNLCIKLDKKGIRFLLSNAATPFIEDLYQDFEIQYVKAIRSINSNGKKRGSVDEVLIRNYESIQK